MNTKSKNNFQENRRGLLSISDAFKNNAVRILGKKGFIEVDIISKWNNIVGDNFASVITPLKITFPINKRSEGTLFVTAQNSSVALEIMHKNLIIISKINSFFGYNAVTKIKIIQDT